ncbi:hypothetical protein BT63DRAFT_199182 [Microthyrium microscopicum]|uniref:Uncharacterized protein n=1 Tax=Microthyrium microscopicum TaxID=703497 RepID=A0A6A6UGX8_9PEZI|nr:hypothetical protein BT63DRAFT_199182 [Microthyrium microscopicum]
MNQKAWSWIYPQFQPPKAASLILLALLTTPAFATATTSSILPQTLEASSSISISNNTSNTSNYPSSCANNNWSPGAAFFTLASLAFCCVAHLPGSLAFNQSGRVWRLVPLFVFVETLAILYAVIRGKIGGYSWRVVCSTILAVRSSNTLPTSVYDIARAQIEDKDKAKKAEDKVDDNSTNEAHSTARDEVSTTSAYKRTPTIEIVGAEEGRTKDEMGKILAVSALVEAKMKIYHAQREVERQREAQKQARWLGYRWNEQIKDKIFLSQLEEVSRRETAISYRVFAWLPMLMLIAKLAVVSGGWNPLTGPKLFGLMFVIGWFAVEFLLIASGSRELNSSEKSSAVTFSALLRKDVEQEDIESNPFKWNWSIFDYSQTTAMILGALVIWLQTAFNLWVPVSYSTDFLVIPFFYIFKTWDFSALPRWLYVVLQPIEKLPIIIGTCLQPGFLLLYFKLLLTIASPVLPAICLRVLTYCAPKSSRLSRHLKALTNELVPANNKYMVPSYVAVVTAGISLARYTGHLNDFWSYNCITTGQPLWYDWLG